MFTPIMNNRIPRSLLLAGKVSYFYVSVFTCLDPSNFSLELKFYNLSISAFALNLHVIYLICVWCEHSVNPQFILSVSLGIKAIIVKVTQKRRQCGLHCIIVSITLKKPPLGLACHQKYRTNKGHPYNQSLHFAYFLNNHVEKL